ncbi:uncharacterized protein LOC129791684 [Lutzomyia longipalpis]|uniref:uncharacterized protein LOC129791684 n=1 Tax=Lutzomyia longipalpis TaxID=7200 RepID=UPI0024843916|nr:uncharacterized protein LOC129791684 [Lutzomyia longipalpis]
MKILDFCIDAGYFVFDGRIFRQLDGVAMGSPLGPIAADIIMQKVLNDVLEMSPLRIDFVIKYVDDLLIAVHSEDKHLLTEAFGSIHDRIKFTIELEQEGKLPYLDLNIHRDRENKLSTSWYTKPSSSQRLLNYNSRHPRYTIVNVARNLIRRSRMLTTNPHENADNQVANILRKNDFPEGVIERLMRQGGRPDTRGTVALADQMEFFHTLTYIRGVSEKLQRKIMRATGIRVAFKPPRKVAEFFSHVKEPVPMDRRCDVVYTVQYSL